MSNEVKGQVKFEIAPIQLKLEESTAGSKVITKPVSRMPSEVKGQVKYKIVPTELTVNEISPGYKFSRSYTKAGNLHQ